MLNVVRLGSIAELRQFVLEVLCAKDNLDPSQTPLHQARVVRREKPCGMFFQVHGPRMLKNYAIWVSDEGRILFYDCNGVRFAETRLSESPDVAAIAA